MIRCFCFAGVSPPAWGRHTWRQGHVVSHRCIPTCVGQTCPMNILCDMERVYPHLRGADNLIWDKVEDLWGVSPPAWGRLPGARLHGVTLRCIPTCVGQTTIMFGIPSFVPVYPHLRGADTQAGIMRITLGGVSPPAWGRP